MTSGWPSWWPAVPLAVPPLLFGFLMWAAASAHARKHGRAVILSRWARGLHYDAKPRSNATFWHKGYRPYTARGGIAYHRLTWWARQRGATRASFFWAPVIAPLFLSVGLLLAPLWTVLGSAAAFAAGVGWAGLRAWRWWAGRAHRQHVEKPAAHALATHLGMSPPVVASRLTLAPNPTDAKTGDEVGRLVLPDHWPGVPGDRQWIEQVMRARIPVPVKFDWQQEVHPAVMSALATALPPFPCPLSAWLEEIDALAAGAFLCGGMHDEVPMIWDTDTSDPMMALNGATRHGKTNQLLGIACQALRRGWRVTYIDPKWVSAQCLIGVPGFVLCNDPRNPREMWAAIHAMRVRVEAAAERHADDPERAPDREMLILDEATQLHSLFRDLWESIMPAGGRLGDCPPWVDCRFILHTAGQFGGRLLVAGQDLNDQVLFRSKGSFGRIAMCSWSPGQFSRMSDVRPIPVPPTLRGRFAVTRGLDKLEWYQALIADPAGGHANEMAWRAYALAGREAEAEAPRVPWSATRLFRRPPAIRPRPERLAIPAVIIGTKAGAEYLGMKQAAFNRARMRTPIEGEFSSDIRRRGHPQPCWQREALDRWQMSRPVAGKRAA